MGIIETLMSGQDMTKAEAKETVKEMRQLVKDGANIEDVLYDYGLELDYFVYLI